ncbi:MAG: ArsR/SmtB family transcription factor [Thermodesulfobacteriota bacterium]
MQEKVPDICQETCVHPDAVQKAKSGELGLDLVQELAGVFRVLGDSTRLRILLALSRSELCVCDLTRVLQMNASAVSHQLRLLRAAKLVKYRREGKNVFYSLDDQHVQTLLAQALEHVQE